MKRNILIPIFLLLFVLGSFQIALAESQQEEQPQESVESFITVIAINQDGALDVTEKITYNFGELEKHGIFRNIPVKYKARGGNYSLRVSNVNVQDENENNQPFEAYYVGDDLEIKIGDPDFFVSGKKTYVINYSLERAINFFKNHDELYWNVNGTGWKVPIKEIGALITLPKQTDVSQVNFECFSGEYGSGEGCEDVDRNFQEKEIFFFEKDLRAHQGMTVVVGFPKGLVHEPSFSQNIKEMAKDNWIIFLPVFSYLFLFYLWRTRGKDPKGKGTIITQFDSPENLSPSEVGTIIDERAENKDITAEIINLAIKGYQKITKIEKQGILTEEDYKLEKLRNADDGLNSYQKELFNIFFEKDRKNVNLSDLKNKVHKDFKKMKTSLYSGLTEDGYFVKNPRKVRMKYLAVGIVVSIAGFFISGLLGAIGAFSFMATGVMIMVFGIFAPQRTRKGVLTKEHILGLKKYLKVAEKDRLRFHNAPEKNPKHFENLLPFALALGVEKQWAKQFKNIYKEPPSWYNDGSHAGFNSILFASSLSNFSTKAQASLYSAPSSAASGGSGFSGGGVGGGFGGGGGGSW